MFAIKIISNTFFVLLPRLLGFISDYLQKRGLTETLEALYKENPKILQKNQVERLIESVNEIRDNPKESDTERGRNSLLFEWWKVFWNILRDKNRNTRTNSINNYNNNNITSAMHVQSKQLPIPVIQTKKLKRNPTSPTTTTTEAKKSNSTTNTTTTTNNTVPSKKGSEESWKMYLNLCKEYQKSGMIPGNYFNLNQGTSLNSGNNSNNTLKFNNVSSINKMTQFNANNNSYLGVIDQVNQPIDSRQLLILRQSLYQEYVKKQTQGDSSSLKSTDNTDNIHNNFNANNTGDILSPNSAGSINNAEFASGANADNSSGNIINTSTDEPNTTPLIIDGKDELDFEYFMNEYLI